MTLYKQLVTGMIFVLSALLISVFFVELSTTRNNLVQQQRSEINNTINTVGLALAPYLENNDKVAIESVINALFDGSSYSVVRLVYLDSGDEILRTYPLTPSHAPKWFLDLNLFEKIHDRRIVTSGWMQLAEIEIVSHPGSAYSQLWLAFERLTIAFCIIMLLGLFTTSLILRRALTPLQQIVVKMEQVASNQFGTVLARPATKELISVVDGINTMSTQLERTFKAQSKEAEQLRQQAYIEPVSQLGNRSYFMNQLNSWLGENGTGGVALLETSFIRSVYDQLGYEAGDEAIKAITASLKSVIPSTFYITARISKWEFGIILPNIEKQELVTLSKKLIEQISLVHSIQNNHLKPSLGVVFCHAETKPSDVLTMLDNSLSNAKANQEDNFSLLASKDEHCLIGKQAWKTIVDEAIIQGNFTFRFQNATSNTGKIYHREVFSSIQHSKGHYCANQYLFALEQLNASHVFDEYIIDSMLRHLHESDLSSPVAINIAQSSVTNAGFIRWISDKLRANPRIVDLLHFEIPESCFIEEPHHTALFCNAVREAGALFGVDNYGRHFQSLEYLNEFRPAYVKLDYLYTHHLEDDSQELTLASISKAAHNLGIKTIACRIETQSQLDMLSNHYIDAFQGFTVK